MDGRQMKGQRLIIVLSFCLVFVSVGSLFILRQPTAEPPPKHREPVQPQALTKPPLQPSSVLWRIKAPSAINQPTRLPDGWLVTSRKGEIVSLTEKGELRWKASYSNYTWQVSGFINKETVCAVTVQGQLVCFAASTGEILWKRETNFFCLNPPLATEINSETVLILISQEEGTLLCLNAKDGEVRWRSPLTNRTDGPAIRLGERIVYGNCDAAVHFFSLTNGCLLGSITLEEDEQIAGGILPLPTGELVVGTYSGTLVLLDPIQLSCLAREKIAPSETFATPALVNENRFVMPTPEGKLTFWTWEKVKLLPDGETPLSTQFDETVIHEGIFWGIARHTIIAFRLADKKEIFRSSPGDDLQFLSPGPEQRCLVFADGELLCMKGT
jgi:PQQ-like domain